MESQTTFVISDLHVGIGDKFDIFHSPTKLAAFHGFMEHARAQPAPVELIVNGDVVDFLQVQPWDDYSEAVALNKMTQIAQKSADVFHGLGEFLAGGPHRITILLGNHDVELIFPQVWGVLRDKILEKAPGAADRLALKTERRTYRTRVNGVLVHVEHGNGQDPWNGVDYQKFVNAAEVGTTDFVYPPGTRMVYDTMNKLKEELQFVDILKPEVPAVVLLLMALRPWGSIKALPGLAKEKARAIANGWLIRLRELVGGRDLGPPENVAANPEELLGQELARHYAAALGGHALTKGLVDNVVAFLNSPEVDAATGQPELGPVGDAIKLRLVDAALGALVRFRMLQETGSDFSTSDHPDEAFALSAQGRFEGDIRVVIYGHTHEALKTEFAPDRLYVNSGTWANLVRLPGRGTGKPERLAWLRSIQDNTFERTAFPTYVRIDPSAAGARVCLCEWKGGPRELWAKDMSP